MLIRKEHTDNDALLGIWEVVEDEDTLLKLLPKSQQEDAKTQTSQFRSNRRVIEWLTIRALLFQLLDEEKIIDNYPNGQPFLVDNSYRISISHTKGYVAILLHKNLSVGIDVETISERITHVAGRIVSGNEFIDPRQEIIHLLLHWSAKETIFKMMDEDEIDFSKHLHIHPFTPKKNGTFWAQELKTDNKKQFKIHYEVHSDFVLTWAVNAV